LKTTFIYINKYISNYYHNKIVCWKAKFNISRLICLYYLEDKSTRFQSIYFYRSRQAIRIPKTPKAIPKAIRIIPEVRILNLGPRAPIRIRIKPTIVATLPPIIRIKGPQKPLEPPPRRLLMFFDAGLETLDGLMGSISSK
jgi:hypothetical protein